MSTPYRDTPERESPRNEPNDLEKKLAEYARVGLPILTVGIALTAGVIQGPASAILVLAGGALIGVIAIFWASVRTLLGETPLSGADAYALAAPRAEEERKRAVLRALKDLEFERSVGKISEADYVELVARYRGEAKRLLREIDAESQPRHERAEALVAKRLRREGVTGATTGKAAPADDDVPVNPFTATTDNTVNTGDQEPQGAASEARPTKGKKRRKAREAAAPEAPALTPAPAPEAATRTCAACSTKNDPDAVFCKKCGARQQAEAEDTTATAPSSDDAEESS
ncbi:MAG: zinc ribbon domain-containing protein [Byssovorax sp.]